MELALSLENALSGLQAAQTNLSLISANVANANTPGYSRQTLDNVTAQIVDGQGAGVNTGLATRLSDSIAKANLIAQQSATSAADTLNTYYQDMQNLFGTPGSANTL